MSNENENSKGKSPTHIAYNVKESRQGNAIFNPVGAAWKHKDGQGYDVQLDSMPVNGRVTLRELREKQVQEFKAQPDNQPEQAPVKQRDNEPTR